MSLDIASEKPENLLDLPEPDKMADTPQNVAAGQFLVSCRRAIELKQLDFAQTLAEKLGVPVSQSTMSGWERAHRTVPGPVIVACLELLGKRLETDVEPAPLALRAEVGRLGGDVRRLGDGLARALEALAIEESAVRRAGRIHDIALEIRGLLADEPEPENPSEEP